ncbi:MAG: 4Fe-4S binding protein [Candidatus Cloacimonadota bacterium]|nr:4Fe-4S binding protein [Candidatus Cloacimonadota bacterium]
MTINKELCDVCSTCVAVCPVAAITISEFEAVIDNEKCIECGKCITVCPIKAIKEGIHD